MSTAGTKRIIHIHSIVKCDNVNVHLSKKIFVFILPLLTCVFQTLNEKTLFYFQKSRVYSCTKNGGTYVIYIHRMFHYMLDNFKRVFWLYSNKKVVKNNVSLRMSCQFVCPFLCSIITNNIHIGVE